jgi:hypothetical protein
MPASHRGGGGVCVASDSGVVYPRGVAAAAAAAAKNYDGEGEKLELKESQTSEAAQKAVIYDSISIENVNSSSPW